jgi:hypothetical protein
MSQTRTTVNLPYFVSTHGASSHSRRLLPLMAVAAIAAAQAPHDYSVHEILSKSGLAQTQSMRLPALDPGKNYSVLFSIDSPTELQPDSRIEVTILDAEAPLAAKTLHLGDPDFYAPFHVSHATRPELRIQATASAATHYSLRIDEWPDSTSLSRGANHRWQDASPMALGQTVYASADRRRRRRGLVPLALRWPCAQAGFLSSRVDGSRRFAGGCGGLPRRER